MPAQVTGLVTDAMPEDGVGAHGVALQVLIPDGVEAGDVAWRATSVTTPAVLPASTYSFMAPECAPGAPDPCRRPPDRSCR